MARIAILHTEVDASLAEALAARLRERGHEPQSDPAGAALALVLATPAFENDAARRANAGRLAEKGERLAVLDLGARRDLLGSVAHLGWDLEGLEGLTGQASAPPAAEPLLLRVRYLADTLRRASGEEHAPRAEAGIERLQFLERYLSARLAVIAGELSEPLAPTRAPTAAAPGPAPAQMQVLAPPKVRPGRTFLAQIAVVLPANPEPGKSRRKVRVVLETARSGPSGSMQQRASGRDGETLRFTFRLRAGRGQPGRSLLRARLECDGRGLGEVSWPLEITPQAAPKPEAEAQGSFRAYLPA